MLTFDRKQQKSVKQLSFKEKHFFLILKIRPNQIWASPMAQHVKNLPAMQKTQEIQVRSLCWEDPLEKAMTKHSSILAWKILQTEEPDGLKSVGLQGVGHD